MITKNILKNFLVAGAIITGFSSSCSRDLNINNNPNYPTDVPENVLLPAAMANMGYTMGGEASRMPGSIMQYYAGHRGQPYDYAIYEITGSSTDVLWTNLYDVLYDLRTLEKKSEASGDKVYLGISQILQAYTFGVTTDLFGDIPFSEALKGPLKINPAYDKQEIIYPQLISMVDKGIANIKLNQGVLKPGSDDLIYGGNILKWEKFGNSLKLRLLNHLSLRQPNAAAQFLATNPNLITNYVDDAKIKMGTSSNSANPMYQFDKLSGREDQAVGSTIVNKMKANNDPRLNLYFEGITNGSLAGQIIGNTPGGDTDDSGRTRFSRIGQAFASINSPIYLITASEVHFIIAENAQKSGNLVTASAAYNEAITQSFNSIGATGASNYLLQPNVIFVNSLGKIMEQKYITMFQTPYEGWSDWRRTGFPNLVVATDNRTNGIIPVRLSYPQIEINVNGASLAAGPGMPTPYEILKVPVWWDAN